MSITNTLSGFKHSSNLCFLLFNSTVSSELPEKTAPTVSHPEAAKAKSTEGHDKAEKSGTSSKWLHSDREHCEVSQARLALNVTQRDASFGLIEINRD